MTESNLHLNEKTNAALKLFRLLPAEENSVGEKFGDNLFRQFGIGNDPYYLSQPYERLYDYEQLLLALKNDNPVKYNNLHKGTPFFFMAWLAFDMKHYSKAMFYADAAIAEDIKHWPHWRSNSAIRFYTLEPWEDNLQLKRTVPKITETLEQQLQRFSNLSGIPKKLPRTIFLSSFVESLLTDGNLAKRSLISALYVFLLEFEELYTMLKTRTVYKGSILPFVTHLFTGGLIFESLLKLVYPTKAMLTLGKITRGNEFKNDFGRNNIDEHSNSLSNILSGLTTTAPIFPTSFSVTSKLRNTTGHNLVWDDVFDDPENYKELFEQEVNAILYVIAKNINLLKVPYFILHIFKPFRKTTIRRKTVNYKTERVY